METIFTWNLPDAAASGSGTLVERPDGGGNAFMPAPLPPVLDPAAIAAPLARADAALVELRRRFQGRPDSEVMSAFRRAACSAKSHARSCELRLRHEPWRNFERDDELYLAAARTSLPLVDLLRPENLSALHRTLTDDGDPATAEFVRPGQFRDGLGLLLDQDGGVAIIFPPAEEIAGLLAKLREYIAGPLPATVSPVLVAAMIIHQVGAIHPFTDGNGRIARYLAERYLIEAGAANSPLPLSLIMTPFHQLYNVRLTEVIRCAAWYQWIDFFCLALIAATGRALALSDTNTQ